VITSWPIEYDREPHVIYAVDENFRILRCNPAWDTFALDNNGSEVARNKVQGLQLFSVIPNPLFAFYSQGFETAKRRGAWQHVFDCSSARIIRRLRMTVTRFGDGWLTRNVTLKDTFAPPSERDPSLAHYGSVITMCCHCRKVWNQKKNVWQWVREFIEHRPSEVRNRLCPDCYAYHYPGCAAQADSIA
jgi:hypothetical protein